MKDRLFDRFVHYETTEGEELPEEPTEAPEPEAPEEPEAAWAPSREEWEQTQAFLGQIAQQMMGQPQQQYEPEPEGFEPPDFDPFDPDSMQQYVDAISDQRVQEALAPIEPLLGHIAESEGERLARAELDQWAGEIGDFDRDQAVLLAQGLLQQGYDADEALQLAAERTHEYEERIRAAEREAYKQHLDTISSAPTPTPAGGAAAEELEGVPTGSKRYELAVKRALAARHPSIPTG